VIARLRAEEPRDPADPPGQGVPIWDAANDRRRPPSRLGGRCEPGGPADGPSRPDGPAAPEWPPRTTEIDPASKPAGNVVARDFAPGRPDATWVTDITYSAHFTVM
jgi:hypothetical protein